MNLGATLGKVTSGSHTTAGFKEDKKNKATPGITTFCALLFRLFIILFIAFFGQTLYYGILFYGGKTSAKSFGSKPDKPLFSLFSKFVGRFYWEKCKNQTELVICARKGVEYRVLKPKYSN